jgi:DNA repair protein RecO (recombination protein O)
MPGLLAIHPLSQMSLQNLLEKFLLWPRAQKILDQSFLVICFPFSALRIIVTGKSEMKTLTQIDSNFVSQSVKGPHDLYTYLYVNELMMRLLPKGLPNQELYDLYQTLLS